jgi:hypothetical protein
VPIAAFDAGRPHRGGAPARLSPGYFLTDGAPSAAKIDL